MVVETDPLTLYTPPTHFEVVKTYPPNFYKAPTSFTMVKTNSPTFYKPPTRFQFVKSGLTKLPQASYTLCGSQNVLSNHVHTSNTF